MKILVMGGSQFVSWYIVKRLAEEGHQVTTLTRGSKKAVHGNKVEELYTDRHNELELKAIIGDKEFEHIIDVSAYTLDDVEKAYNCFIEKNIKSYVFISSSAVYIESPILPIKEDFPKGENKYWGAYGTNKLEAENFLISKFKENGFPVNILRPPYIYGEGNNVYREAFIFDRLKEGKDIILPNNGETLVQFIHIEDLYKSIEALINTNIVGQAYNVGEEKGISLKDWVQLCIDTYGSTNKIAPYNYKENGYHERDFFPFFDYEYFLDVEEISKIYKPKINMVEGLKKSLEWYLENEDKVGKRQHYHNNSDKIMLELKTIKN